MPLLEGAVLHGRWHPAQMQGFTRLQLLLLTLIHDGAPRTPVYPHRQVLAVHQQLQGVQRPVIHRRVAEHRRHGVITNVETDTHTPPEDLDGDVLVEALV